MAPTPNKYCLVSLPLNAFDSGDKEEALEALQKTIESSNGEVVPFSIPDFKIGTLDALYQQAENLGKLNSACEGLVSKVGDALRTLNDDDQEKIAQYKLVNDKPTDQYLRTFNWNKVRYRADKPIGELVDNLQKELATIDNDIKAKLNQYNQIKTSYAALQRKQTGNLATKSLTPIVDPSILVQDSEYLETHLIVVPTNVKKEFLQSYESLAPMVVPRSAMQVAQDDEFTLYAVTTFKKHSPEFLQKAREAKWTPRSYKYVEGGKEEEQKELDRVGREEKKVWGEALRLSRTGWSESAMIWAHVLTLRVFVETVLRYGLPLEFISALTATKPKLSEKVKTNLDKKFGHLGGNAFGKDKKGNNVKDDAALSSEMAAAGMAHGEGNEYTAFVWYEFEL
ncbi:uncharacterized protein BCR38DRAFT_339095 [Pseudomassariella vexata]|uniref:V-type proton ATPase subunit C n=1 Tax=Pseudomassariella vexata TaxID=1141098 RepID=A0A1Y2E6L2_9PEZI|nr:uncharacterized protein BCR38DRAFT_339095 [Pseudomassariella vexata]ORY66505.1 hypothetical protein BCR38DRAFT_339095 [Pseudomassariella vexata]